MISTKKLIKMARKWQRLAKESRKRISLSGTRSSSASGSSQAVVEKGHFVVYTSDERRFALPLTFLQSAIFRELLRWAEEEFGLTSNGPITLPCDSAFMDYAISIIRRQVTRELEEALILSLSNLRCSLSSSSLSSSICLQKQQLPISCC